MNKKDLKHRMWVAAPLLTGCLFYSTFTEASTSYGADKLAVINAPHSQPIRIQLGAFRSETNANRLRNKWQTMVKYPVYIEHTHTYYRVIVGPIPPNNVARFEPYPAPQHISETVHNASATTKIHDRSSRSKWLKNQNQPSVSIDKDGVVSSTLNQRDGWYFGVEGGVLKPHTGSMIVVQNGSSFMPPEDIDQYSTQLSNHTMVAADIGHFWQRDEQLLPGYTLGLRYQYFINKNISGRITQYSLPEFENYDYSMGIQANVLSAYGKLQLVRWGHVMPYINGGVGVIVTKSSKYTERADPDVTPRYSPAYASGTQTNLAYDFGFGLDYAVNSQWLLSLGYDFQKLGNIRSGNGVSTWSSQRLKLNNFYANTALLGVSYLFDASNMMK